MPSDLRPMTYYVTFYSNYSAISHGNPVFQQMTLIWPFKVTKGQTDYAIRSATYDFLLTFYSNYIAISLRLRDIRLSNFWADFDRKSDIWPFQSHWSSTDFWFHLTICSATFQCAFIWDMLRWVSVLPLCSVHLFIQQKFSVKLSKDVALINMAKFSKYFSRSLGSSTNCSVPTQPNC